MASLQSIIDNINDKKQIQEQKDLDLLETYQKLYESRYSSFFKTNVSGNILRRMVGREPEIYGIGVMIIENTNIIG